MADFWIILGVKAGQPLPCRHKTLEIAQAEQARLSALVPDKHFRLYRCKTWHEPSQRYAMMREALTRLAPDELARIDAAVPEHVPLAALEDHQNAVRVARKAVGDE